MTLIQRSEHWELHRTEDDLHKAMEERDRYLKALHHIAWRLHLCIGDKFFQKELDTIYEHLDHALPFEAPE